MSRSSPQISPAQKQNLANISRAQARDEAKRRDLETMGRELDRSFADAREKLDKSAAMLAKHAAWSDRYGHWIARAALLPVTALAIGMIIVVGVGLWSGEIKELHKYSKLYVNRTGNPISYWASVVYHGALAAFIAWIALTIFRNSKFGKKKADYQVTRPN